MQQTATLLENINAITSTIRTLEYLVNNNGVKGGGYTGGYRGGRGGGGRDCWHKNSGKTV